MKKTFKGPKVAVRRRGKKWEHENKRYGTLHEACIVQSVKQLGQGLDIPGFSFLQQQEMFLFCKVSIPALGSTQPLIQLVTGFLHRWVKRMKCEAHHSPSSNVDVENAWGCSFTPPQTSAACTGTLFRAPAEGTCEVRRRIFGVTGKWLSRQELRLLCYNII